MLTRLWTTLTWKSSYWKPAEFRCKCGRAECDAVLPQQEFIKRLDELRARMGVPLLLTSGSRCVRHNIEVGGAPNSAHLHGLACDIDTTNLDAVGKLKIKSIACDLFEGIGVGRTMIHVDLKHATKLFWEYDLMGRPINYKRI